MHVLKKGVRNGSETASLVICLSGSCALSAPAVAVVTNRVIPTPRSLRPPRQGQGGQPARLRASCAKAVEGSCFERAAPLWAHLCPSVRCMGSGHSRRHLRAPAACVRLIRSQDCIDLVQKPLISLQPLV